MRMGPHPVGPFVTRKDGKLEHPSPGTCFGLKGREKKAAETASRFRQKPPAADGKFPAWNPPTHSPPPPRRPTAEAGSRCFGASRRRRPGLLVLVPLGLVQGSERKAHESCEYMWPKKGGGGTRKGVFVVSCWFPVGFLLVSFWFPFGFLEAHLELLKKVSSKRTRRGTQQTQTSVAELWVYKQNPTTSV